MIENNTRTEEIDIAAIDPHSKNYRIHPPAQIQGIRASLGEFGYVRRIVVQEKGDGRFLLAAGEGVFTALKKEGAKRIEATILPADWPASKVTAYLVADNELPALAETDEGRLLEAIKESEVALGDDMVEAMGLSDDFLRYLIDQPAKEGETAVKPGPQRGASNGDEGGVVAQAKYKVNPGDVWMAGDHFVTCGDCRDPEAIVALFAAAGVDTVQGIFTSPPYADQRKDHYESVPPDQYVEWWSAVQDNARGALAPTGSLLINIKPHTDEGERSLYVFDLVLAMRRRWGWRFVEEFCWERPGMPGDAERMRRFKNQFEPVYHFSLQPDFKWRPQNVMYESEAAFLDKNYKPGLNGSQGLGGDAVMGDRTRGEGLAYPGNRIRTPQIEALGHPAAYPSELPEFFILALSDKGDFWLDPFCGSGSTIAAAQATGRVGLGIEKKPEYVAMTLARLEKLTGETPIRVTRQAVKETEQDGR